jgi:hypothetical protein
MLLERKVTTVGIKIRGKNYFHLKLFPYTGTNVLIKQTRKRLKIFNRHGVLICKAKETTFSEEMKERKPESSFFL